MAAFQTIVKNGVRYHYYPKGRGGSGKPEYIKVAPPTKGATVLGNSPAPAAGGASAAPAEGGGAPEAPAAPPINPFLTAADLADLNNFNFANANSLADIDKQLADLATQTAYNREQTDRTAKHNTAEGTDSAIGRGMFRSSIKDATLYDIEGQRVRQQQLYTDQTNNAVMDADRRKAIIRQAQEANQTRMDNQAVENARGASADQPVSVPQAPAAPATLTPGAPAAYQTVPGTDSQGRPGKWHIYPDGRRVFVRGG